MPYKLTSISVSLPFGLGSVSVARTEAQSRAAWALYVEIATRVSTQPLAAGQGSAREALSSIYSLFETTRSVLSEQGPSVAEGPESVGPLAIRILNEGVRPFLTEWHTKLGEYEDGQRQAWYERFGGNSKPIVDEAQWPEIGAFRDALAKWQEDMRGFVTFLAELADVHHGEG